MPKLAAQIAFGSKITTGLSNITVVKIATLKPVMRLYVGTAARRLPTPNGNVIHASFKEFPFTIRTHHITNENRSI